MSPLMQKSLETKVIFGASRVFALFALVFAPATAHAAETPCEPSEIEYTLSARVRLTDTLFGAGNGEHAVGPGKIVLRFDGGNVTVASYEMPTRFTVDARILGIGTTVTTDTMTRAVPLRGAIGSGFMDGRRVIRWRGPWNGLQTDGTLLCRGTCGKFGAPPHGKSELHMPRHTVAFGPFVLSPNEETLHMEYAVVHKSSASTASLVLTGRETRRTCVARAERDP